MKKQPLTIQPARPLPLQTSYERQIIRNRSQRRACLLLGLLCLLFVIAAACGRFLPYSPAVHVTLAAFAVMFGGLLVWNIITGV